MKFCVSVDAEYVIYEARIVRHDKAQCSSPLLFFHYYCGNDMQITMKLNRAKRKQISEQLIRYNDDFP